MQVQPVPDIEVAVRPVGSVSVTVTVPVVEAKPPLDTMIAYVAPVWPWLKLPVWVLVMVRSGIWPMVVRSLAVSFEVLNSPPPETVAVFVMIDEALLATLTVRVIDG